MQLVPLQLHLYPLHASTFAFPVLTYLLLSHVNTLNALVFDATLTAFVIRVASAIHASISRALVSNIPLFDDVRSPVADVSTYAGAAAVHAAETCVLFTAPVTATPVLAAGVFPYLEDNAYVMCVSNHLKVDVGWIRYMDRLQRPPHLGGQRCASERSHPHSLELF